MRVKQNVYCFGVVFVYTFTAITSLSAWRPTAYSVQTAIYDDELRTTIQPFRKRLQLSLKPGGGGGGGGGGRPEPRTRTKSFSLEGGSSSSPRHGNCSGGQIKHVVHGKFYFNGQLEPNILNQDYQSDSAVSVQAQGGQAGVRGQRLSSLEESWQKLQPVVECGDDGMTLTVRRRRAVQLQLDRANESSVPLSQLSPRCGYSVQTSWRDLSLMARYDACHVTQEGESYVLPLLWRGTPTKVSCPLSEAEPQVLGVSSLCCSPDGMTIKLQGPSASEEQRIAVRGEWTPLTQLAEQCGYTLDRQDAQTVIAAPFISCGITVKDGKHTLSLQVGEKIFTLGCPISSPEEQPVAHQPPHQTTKPALTLLWPPPFYLAPPNYPHPTYHHGHATPEVSTPEPLPPVDSQHGYRDQFSHRIPEREQVYPDKNQNQQIPLIELSEKEISAPTGFPAQAEATQLKPVSQDFSPYYHYYHLPKIPLHGTHHKPDPGLDVSGELSNSHHPELTTNIRQPESQPSSTHPHTLPPNPVFSSPLHAPYPYFYYFPQAETKKQDLLHPDQPAQTELSSLHKRPRSAMPSVRSMNPNTDINSEEFLSDDVESEVDKRFSSSETDPPSEQPSPTPPLFVYEHHPYQNYYQHYYDLYQMYYGPVGFLPADMHVSPSPAQHQTAASPTESTKEIQNGLPTYHLKQPTGSEDEAACEPPLSSGGEQGAETGYPSVSMPLHDFYSHISQQHHYDPFNGGEEKPDAETKVSDCVSEPPVLSSEDSSVSCMLQQLTSDSDIVLVPVYDCGVISDLFSQTVVDPVDVERIHPHQDGESSHVRLMVGCSSSTNPPGDMMDQPPLPHIQPKPSLHLRIATDESFSSFHPEPHLPLSLVQGRTLYVEVSLLDPPEPNLRLLLHSCWAYTEAPYASWTLVYDGCVSRSVLQQLPSPDSHHIQRITLSSFLFLSSENPPCTAPLEEPEIYFLCLAEVCSAADNDCTLSCKGPNSDV